MSMAVLRIYQSSMHWHTISLGFENGGTPDNYDTEYTEHQHIIDAKNPYRRSNKVNPLNKWLKQLYLDTFTIALTTLLPLPPDGKGFSDLGSPTVPDVSDSFSFRGKNLELCIRSYLYDRQYPEDQ